MTAAELCVTRLDKFARVGTCLVGFVGAIVLVGWMADVASLKGVLPGLLTMKVNTACGFIFSAAALWLLHTAAPGSQSFRVARVLAGVVALVGLLTMAEENFDVDLGIDRVIQSAIVPANSAYDAGRMSPATAFNFFILGTALLVFKARHNRLAAGTHWLVVLPLFVSAMAIVGYAYGVDALYKVGPYSAMALHTALSFFILTLSTLAADSSYGFARIATSDTVGGDVSRWLLPTLPPTLFILGWFRLKGEEAGWYKFHFGLALMVMISIIVSVVAVAWTATVLHRTDLTRRLAEAKTRNINTDLEQRVVLRTRQLAKLSAELGEANKTLEQFSLKYSLTGLANRRHLDRYLDSQIAVANRYKRPLALVLCDVDSFKAYNDHYGHQAGDLCLQRVAAAIQSCCRRPADLAARYGGEEIAVVLPDTDLDGAVQIAEAIKKAVTQLRIQHSYSPAGAYVSVSGGIAGLSMKDRTTARQLITAADQSLYEAKSSGRNRMVSARAEPV